MARVFSEAELLEGGRLTVDLIAEHLDAGHSDAASELVDRFQLELMTMFFSYTGWETSILGCIEETAGAEARAAALSSITDYELAPERDIETDGVAAQWKQMLAHIQSLIDEGSHGAAGASAHALRDEALVLHDGLMSRVSALLSIVYDQFGDTELQRVLNIVMKPEAMDPDGKLPFREKVENIMTFTRCHLLPFSVTEDEEKVTFMPDPCPSGARLIRNGHYEAPRNNAMVSDVGPLTYGRAELPVYCCHEPAMELSSILKTGVPLFLVDPPEDVGISPCKIYVYKNPEDIPERYFERVGLAKPAHLIASSGGG